MPAQQKADASAAKSGCQRSKKRMPAQQKADASAAKSKNPNGD
jgi:hypothetical protein